jgi:hypothetical protein
MTFTNDILRVYRKKNLALKEKEVDIIHSAVYEERLGLKDLFIQVKSQQDLFKTFELVDDTSFYKSVVESELIVRVQDICETIDGAIDYQNYIIADIKNLLSQDASSFINANAFIDCLYSRVVEKESNYDSKYYKYYRIVVKKLIEWKLSINGILSIKATQKLIVNLLSTIIRSITKVGIQIPRMYDLRAYLDIVLTPKDYCLVVYNNYQHSIINVYKLGKNEKRLYKIINPINRV